MYGLWVLSYHLLQNNINQQDGYNYMHINMDKIVVKCSKALAYLCLA